MNSTTPAIRELARRLTGWGAEHDRRRTQESGFDQHLVKPVDTEVLTRMIAEMPVKST